MPTACTASNRAASSPGCPAAAIQLADSLISPISAMQRGGDVGERFADRHARRSRRINQGHAACARQARMASPRYVSIAHRCHGHIRYRNLPWAHHLVTGRHAADGTVADADEKGLVRHGRQAKHSIGRFAQIQSFRQKRATAVSRYVSAVRDHFRRLAQQHRKTHINRTIARIPDPSPPVVLPRPQCQSPQRTAFALANCIEEFQRLRPDGKHITLLGLIAPDLHRRHPGFLGGNVAQIQVTSPTRSMQKFR